MGIQPIRKVVAPEIPDKLYFRIGDVARLCEVPAYVLRFWETEFPQLKPSKGGTGQRLYRRRDVEMALRIKSLLYDQRYTIPGARQVFKDEAKARETATAEACTPASTPAEGFGKPGFAQDFEQKSSPQPRITPVAARTQISTPNREAGPADGPASPLSGDLQAKLSALRDEMRTLLTLLGAASGRQPASHAQPTPMRPRLVLEPRTPFARPDAARPEMLRLVRDVSRELPREAAPVNQGDLFAGE